MKKLDGRSKKARALKLQRTAFLPMPIEPLPLEIPSIIHGHVNKYKPIDLTPKETILQEAQSLIYGAREAEYGDPKKNLSNIARQWTLYINQRHIAKDASEVWLVAEDVCWMMALLKMCREHGGEKRDGLCDAAGYIGLIERVRS